MSFTIAVYLVVWPFEREVGHRDARRDDHIAARWLGGLGVRGRWMVIVMHTSPESPESSAGSRLLQFPGSIRSDCPRSYLANGCDEVESRWVAEAGRGEVGVRRHGHPCIQGNTMRSTCQAQTLLVPSATARIPTCPVKPQPVIPYELDQPEH